MMSQIILLLFTLEHWLGHKLSSYDLQPRQVNANMPAYLHADKSITT